MRAYAHSISTVDGSAAWMAFRAASEGGGSPPEWTTQGDDPSRWIPPSDAAGSLWLRMRDSQVPNSVAYCAGAFGFALDTAQAAYFSSGGQGVFLFSSGDAALIIVARAEEAPRTGERERNIVLMDDARHSVECRLLDDGPPIVLE